MKKLSLVALLAAITFGGVEAASARMVAMPVAAPAPTVQLGDPYLTHESEQDIEYYLGLHLVQHLVQLHALALWTALLLLAHQFAAQQ